MAAVLSHQVLERFVKQQKPIQYLFIPQIKCKPVSSLGFSYGITKSN